jgi:Bacterial sugar transferase/CoA-binding domain
VAATALAAMTVLTLRELFAASPELAAQTIRPWAFATAYLAAGRIALHWSHLQARRQGEAMRPTLIVGAGRIGRLIAKRLLATPELGLRPVGFLDKDPLESADGAVMVPVLGASWDLEEVVERHGVEQVIVTFSRAPNDVLLRLVRRCEELGVSVSFVPRLFEKVNGRVTVEHLGGLPLVSALPANPRGRRFAIKYAFDRVAAALALLLVLPIIAASAVVVWISLGRPIFFRQVRVGRDGRPFEMLKFRSMRQAAAAGQEAGADLELPPDTAPGGVEGQDRRTRVGAFLRRAAAAHQRPQGRDEPGRAAAGAARVRRPLRGERLPLQRPAPCQGRHHRLGAGQRGCAGRRRSPTGSSGTITTSRTGRSGSISRSRS